MRSRVCAALCAVWIGLLTGGVERAFGAALVLTDLLDPELDRARVRSVLTRQLGMGVRLEPPPPVLLESLLALPPIGLLEQCDATAQELQEAHAGLISGRSRLPLSFYQLFQLEQELVELRLLELDLDAVETHLQAAWKLVPCLERVLQPEEVRALFLADATAHVIRGAPQAESKLLELIGAAPGVGLEADAPPRVKRAYDKALLVSSKQKTQTLSLDGLGARVFVDGTPATPTLSLKPGRHILQVRDASLLARTRVLTVPPLSSQKSKVLSPQSLFVEQPWTDLQAARRGLERALASGKPGHAVQGVLEAWLEQQGRAEAAFASSEAGGDSTPRYQIYRRGEGLIPLQASAASSSGPGTAETTPEEALESVPAVGRASAVGGEKDVDRSEAAVTPAVEATAEPEAPAEITAPAVQGAAELLGEGASQVRRQASAAAVPSARKASERVPEKDGSEAGSHRSAAQVPFSVGAGVREDVSTHRPAQDPSSFLAGVQAGAGLRVDLPALLGTGGVVQQGGGGVGVWGAFPVGPVVAQAAAGLVILRPGGRSSDEPACSDAILSAELSQAQAELLAGCQANPPVFALELGAGVPLEVGDALRVTPALRGMVLSVPALLVPGAEGEPAWTLVRALSGGLRLAVGAHWQLEALTVGVELGAALLVVPTGTELRWLGLASLTPGVEVAF